jgi:cell division protein FtsQ
MKRIKRKTKGSNRSKKSKAKSRKTVKLPQFPRIPIRIFLVITAIIGPLVVLHYDPLGFFLLKRISIMTETHHVTHDEILKRASITLQTPLTQLRLVDIQERIEKHPWIRAASLRRSFPNQLSIYLQEHEPVALLKLKELYLISSTGTPLKILESSDPMNFPVITGLKRGDNTKERTRLQQRINESLSLITWLETTAALEPFGLSEIHWDKASTLSLITRDKGIPIIVGTAPWQEKLERLIPLITHISQSGQEPKKIILNQGEGIIARYSLYKEDTCQKTATSSWA